MVKTKFKVGDRVKIIKKILNPNQIYWVKPMDDTVGSIERVMRIYRVKRKDNWYHLSNGWCYTEDVLELVSKQLMLFDL